MRSTFMRVAASSSYYFKSWDLTAIYLNNTGIFSKKITIATGNDQKNLLVALPDGSRIFLNRNSEFSYRSNFGKQQQGM